MKKVKRHGTQEQQQPETRNQKQILSHWFIHGLVCAREVGTKIKTV